MNAHPTAGSGTGDRDPERDENFPGQGRRFLGIDVGAETIKVVELLKHGSGVSRGGGGWSNIRSSLVHG